GLFFVGAGNTFVAVQRLLVLGADLVDETVHVVSGRRNNVRIATLVYDPTPVDIVTLTEKEIDSVIFTSREVAQPRCTCYRDSGGSSVRSIYYSRNQSRGTGCRAL